jgi:hypothetical protein
MSKNRREKLRGEEQQLETVADIGDAEPVHSHSEKSKRAVAFGRIYGCCCCCCCCLPMVGISQHVCLILGIILQRR